MFIMYGNKGIKKRTATTAIDDGRRETLTKLALSPKKAIASCPGILFQYQQKHTQQLYLNTHTQRTEAPTNRWQSIDGTIKFVFPPCNAFIGHVFFLPIFHWFWNVFPSSLTQYWANSGFPKIFPMPFPWRWWWACHRLFVYFRHIPW